MASRKDSVLDMSLEKGGEITIEYSASMDEIRMQNRKNENIRQTEEKNENVIWLKDNKSYHGVIIEPHGAFVFRTISCISNEGSMVFLTP